MKKLSLLALCILAGCNQQSASPSDLNHNRQTFGRCKTPELVKELKSQPTINDQFAILYNKFDYTLDISDSLPGPDENKDGYRSIH